MDGEITMGRLEQIKLFVHTGLGIYFLCYRAKTEMEILSDYKRLRARELDEQLEQISRKVEKMRAED
jgi:ABC-type long-subunit fatty acid transport system fused permease/ATPase subunit